MRPWFKPEIALSGLLFLLAFLLLLGGRGEEEVTVAAEPSEVATPRHARKSDRSRAGRERKRRMPPLSQYPSARIVSTHAEWGFVVLRPGTLSVAKGEIGYFEGIPGSEAWIRISGADEEHLIADLGGRDPGRVSAGDRVVFRNRPIVLRGAPRIDPREIRWTNPDGPGWVDE